MKYPKFLIVVLAVFFGLFTPQGAQAHNVKQVIVEGNKRVETPTILSLVEIKRGAPLSEFQREEALKSLYATGYFSDVLVLQDGYDVIIKVVENQIINTIAFEGNERIKDDLILAELGIRPRSVYTPARAQEAAQKIRDMYRVTGRYAAKVEPKIIQRDQSRVDLVFEIEEGAPTRVNRILFVGNHRFSDSALEKVIMTKESRWYRFFTIDDSYDPNRLAYDRELLRRHYLQHGYVEFRVKSVVAELDPQDQDFFITYTVEEGDRYEVGCVEIQNEIPRFNPDGLERELLMSTGDWFDSTRIEKTMERLVDACIKRGQNFIQIEPKVDADPKTKKVKIKFVLKEGKRVYVNRINIIGNDRTNDRVIRREFRFVEGDPYNKIKIDRTEQRLKNTGFFRKVELKEEQTSVSDKVDITAEVEDQPTGSMKFAAGYSTTDKAMGSIGLQERNLMGKGLVLDLSAMVSTRSQDFRAGFADPYFLDRRLLMGVEAFHTKRDWNTRNSSSKEFEQRTTGGTLHTGYEITENLSQDWSYTYAYEDLGSFKGNISPFLVADKGTFNISAVTHDIFYDRRDDALDPTEGYYAGIGNKLAGIGGNVRHLKNGLSAGIYTPLDDNHKVVLANKVSAGAIIKFDKRIRYVDKYRLGGESLRGFDPDAGIGPRDVTTGDALGGRYFYKFTSELQFPLGLPSEMGVKGIAFVDVGSVWKSDWKTTTRTTPPIATFVVAGNGHSPRVSTGLGVNWKSPLGPVGVSWAWPLKKKRIDVTKKFMVNFGTNF